MALTAGQVSDHIGAKLLYPALPNAEVLIGDKGYDSDEFRAALRAKDIKACIPPRSGRNTPATYSKTLYNNVIRLKMPSIGSRISAELRPDTTDAQTSSSLQ